MKASYTAISILAASLLLAAQPAVAGRSAEDGIHIEKCSARGGSSFAIITDSETYGACREELHAYRDVLEQEGLATYIAHSEWKSPDQIKALIARLYAGKPALEGVVFVGDVPIVMVREAQHMTTAFKMNEQEWPVFESSVASDRFYDDFDLRFDFICRDSLRSDVFYYRLSEKGAQHLDPDIYSARMKVPATMDGDKHAIMRAYLRKVVDAHRNPGVLDRMRYFAGRGYNSDCLTLWRQKPLAFRESFPYCFSTADGNSFLNFRQQPGMKYRLLEELERKGTDFFMFSEHGAPEIQYISPTSVAENLDECVDLLKRRIASMYKKYRGTEDEEAFIHEALDSLFHIEREMLSDSSLTVLAGRDSAAAADADIFLDDIKGIRSNPRIIVFNACYNGSFHREEGYVAGCHVFGEGDCVVAQGNTVNVLQDKWEDKLIGYLSIGERVGIWQRENPYLESHLIGDPTFRFLPHDEAEARILAELHSQLISRKCDTGYWLSCLDSEMPVLRSAGVTHLAKSGRKEFSDRIFGVFLKDKSPVVRLHALNALAAYGDANFKKAVELGLNDGFEPIVRTSCSLAMASGDSALLPALEKAASLTHMMRVCDMVAPRAISVISGEKAGRLTATVSDSSAPARRRINAMRSFRNDRSIAAVEPLLAVAGSPEEDENIRKIACEVLGWYVLSDAAPDIVKELRTIAKTQKKTLPESVRKEIEKTVKRLTNS